ncbi:MAG: transcriptional repressor [Duncaniella sp.]|nr:transcriptional repressor [Duncaniella sp.]
MINNSEKRKSTARIALENFIESKGKRLTLERIAILDTIMEQKGPFTVAILGELLSGKGFRVSRATLYNNLQLFSEAGLIGQVPRLNSAGGMIEWEAIGDRTFLLSLVCIRCGKVRPVRNHILARQMASSKFASFSPLSADITVRGVCARCNRRQSKLTAKQKPQKP